MRLELRHADLVTRIASAGSISAAAATLSIPQPSLTTQLRRIERMLGGPLFVRSRRGVSPTPLGDRLIPMMADLVVRSEAIVRQARTGTPVVRLGVPEWTPVALRRAVDAALPGVEVESTTVRPGTAAAAVAQGVLTAALHVRADPDGASRSDASAPGTRTVVVAAEPVWLALPRAHPWAAQRAVVPEQLGALRWVLRSADSWFGTVENWLLRRSGVVPAPVHRAAGEGEALEWVAEASLAALVGGSVSAPGVTVVPLASPAVLETVLVHREEGLPVEVGEPLVGALRGHWSQRAVGQPRYGEWLLDHLHEHPDLVGSLVGGPG